MMDLVVLEQQMVDMRKEPPRRGVQASMKVVLTLYSILLVVVTGVMAAVTAISSGKSALTDSQRACDTGLEQCFDVGKKETSDLGRLLMTEVVTGFQTAVEQKLKVPLSLLCIEHHMADASGLGRGNFTLDEHIHDTLIRKLTLSFLEAEQDVGTLEVEVRSVDATTNQSTWYLMTPGYYVPPAERQINLESFLGLELLDGNWGNISQGQLYAAIVNHTTGHIITLPPEDTPPCSATFVEISNWEASSGAARFSQCKAPLSSFKSAMTGRGTSGYLPYLKYDSIGWAPVEAKGELISLSAYYAWIEEPTEVYGMSSGYWFTVGVSLDDLSDVAKAALKSLPKESRIYVVERDPWTKKMGSLVAVSHGNPYLVKNTSNAVTYHIIPPSSATDSVISAHGAFMEGFSDDAYFLNQTDHPVISNWTMDGRVWWLLTKMMRLSSLSEHPLVLTMVVLLDSDIALQEVTESFNNVSRQITTERNQVSNQSEENITYLWMSLVGMLVVLGLLAYCCSYRIAAGITGLATEMEAVSMLELDHIVLKPSLLTEVNLMQKSFEAMTDQLKIYKMYLPKMLMGQPLGEAEYEPSEASRDSKETGSSEVYNRNNPSAPSRGDIASQPATPAEKEESGGSSHTPTPTKKNALSRRRSLGNFLRDDKVISPPTGMVKRKSLVVMTVRLCHLHDWLALLAEEAKTIENVSATIGDWVALVEKFVTCHKGTILTTCLGDGELTAIWGYTTREFTGLTTAVDAALNITSKHYNVANSSSLDTFAAITDAPGWAGSLGSGQTKSPAIVGPHIKENQGILSAAFRYKTPIVTGSRNGLEAYEVVPIDCCFLHNLVSVNGVRHGSAKSIMIYSILKRAETEGAEWMYNLGHQLLAGCRLFCC
eukprot:TRINITY_DN18572_c0_g1_i1.p1 TRINITY_DN18572_c0_g1~~TRINITY_DN18572_c0_g1_i1.p1  ORF type:complete len:883 (+),score=73.50 TRINITY_DN18572_c0_g1_i1:61-2709(+)